MRTREPLQLYLSPLAEGDVAAAVRQFLEQRRDQDFAAASLRGDAGGQVNVPAEEVRSLLDHLAGVQADAHSDRLLGRLIAAGEDALDIDGALQRLAGALERQHETGARRLHLQAAPRLHPLPPPGV